MLRFFGKILYMMFKKLKIKETAQNFIVLAITTTDDDYYLVWNLNNALSLNLNRTEHPMLKKEIPEGESISYFNCVCDETKLEYSLIGNKYDKFKLFPQLAGVDFVLKISGNLTNEKINQITGMVRSVKGVTACINLNVKKTPSLGILQRI